MVFLFLKSFYSTGVYSDHASSFILRHQYLFRTYKNTLLFWFKILQTDIYSRGSYVVMLLKKSHLKINIDDVGLYRRNPKQKKWSIFAIVGTYCSGVKMALKVKITPMETTKDCKLMINNKCLMVVCNCKFIVIM